MSKKSNLERVRNKFEAERSKVKREYEILEERIRKERDKRLADSEREFRKEFGVAVKELLGKDCEWLIQGL